MAQWNPHKKLLDATPNRQIYKLHDPQEPDLLREIFPYTEVCKTPFDHVHIMPEPCDEMLITDTTFRDGQQARPPYTVQQISTIFDFLHRLSGPKGIIRQTEFFLYTQKDKEAIWVCREKGYKFPEITGWIRANKADLQLVKEMGLRETGILTSISDYHIFLKLKKTRAKALEDYLTIVKACLEEDITPRCHFEDITRADIYGFCVPFAIELMKLREESDIDIKIRLCDTLGYGVPYPGAAPPRSVGRIVHTMIHDAGVPSHLLEWHGHNDFHKALINASTAWLYGCGAVNGTLLGFGERTGNTPIEALLIERISLRGAQEGIDTRAITEMAEYFERELHVHIPRNYPIIGADSTATSAGIHADGLLKNEEIYNVFDTDHILGRPIAVIVSDKSGTAGIAHWVNTKLKLKGEKAIDKKHPGIGKIYKKVMQEYENGRITSMSDDEIELLARKYLPEFFPSGFAKLESKAKELALHLAEDLVEQSVIRSMDPAQIEPILTKTLEENPFIQFLYVVNTEGKKITRNITHLKYKAQYATHLLNEDFSDRSWFIEPMQDGKCHVSPFYTSKVTGALCITVSAPIINDSDEIIGILGIDIRFEDLAKMEQEESSDK